MKKINLNAIFESLVKGDLNGAKEKFHSYTISEGRKINNEILKEDEDTNIDTSSECTVSIDLNNSDASADEINSIFDEIFSDLGIDADVVFDEEENKYTLTFDTEEEADNFNDALVDKVNSLNIDEIEIEDCDSEDSESNLDEAYDDEYPAYSEKEEKLIEDTVNDFNVDDFFNEYGDDFGINDSELSAEDKVFTKNEIVDSIAHYLLSYSERFLNDDESNPLNVEDFEDSAEDIFDETVKPAMEEKGYSFSETTEEGEDLGKPGKNFAKIAKSAAKEYGSKEAGERVAGSVLSKLRKEHPRKYSESSDDTNKTKFVIGLTPVADEYDVNRIIDKLGSMGIDGKKEGNKIVATKRNPDADYDISSIKFIPGVSYVDCNEEITEDEIGNRENTIVSIITRESNTKLKHYVEWFNNYFDDNNDGYIDSIKKGSFTKNTIRLIFRDEESANDTINAFSNENDGDYDILIDGKDEFSESLNEIGNNQSPIDIARRMGYDAAKDGNENKFNAELRALMNDKAGDAQREDIHKAYIEGMDEFHKGSKVNESESSDSNKSKIIITFTNALSNRKNFKNDPIVLKVEAKLDVYGYTNHKWVGKKLEVNIPSDELDYEYHVQRAFKNLPGVSDIEIVDNINESKVDGLKEGSFDNNIGTVTIKLEDNIDDNVAEKLFNKIYHYGYSPEWSGKWDSEIKYEVPSDADYEYDLRVFKKQSGVESVNFEPKENVEEDEGLDIDVDSDAVDTVAGESEDDKLDLILSKISELEAQIADLDDESTDDVDVDVEEELPEDGEDYDDLSEDYKLEPVKTEPNTDGEEVGNGKKIKGNDESPMSDLEKFRLDINDKGIQSPSKNNAKGYEWKDTPKVDKNNIKGDIKNAEQKLEKVNKDDKKALVNQSQGKENDESVLGNGTINESRRRVLRTRR